MKFLDHTPILALTLITITVVLHFTIPVSLFIDFPYSLVGLIGIIFGLWLTLSGKKLFEKFNTTVRFGKSSKLVTIGPYLYSRNPMYLGILTLLLGITILMGNIIVFILPLAFFIVMNFRNIPNEERIMQEAFGGAYLNYKKKVRRWI